MYGDADRYHPTRKHEKEKEDVSLHSSSLLRCLFGTDFRDHSAFLVQDLEYDLRYLLESLSYGFEV